MGFSAFYGISQGRVDGFYKGKGNLDFAVGGGCERNPSYYAGTDKIVLTRDIVIGSAFVAYGITSKLDVNLSLPYIDVNGREKGLQDLSVSLKHKLLEDKGWTISLAGGFSSNLTDYQIGGGSALGQQAKIIDGRVVIHYLLEKGFFTTLQGGYSYKIEPVPHSIPFAIKVGVAKPKYYIDAWYEFQYGIGGFDYRGDPPPPSFRELGVSYHKIGATIYKPIKDFLGIYGGGSYVLSGRNVSQGIGVNLGVVLKYNKKNKDE